ncbi:MAG TPA: glycosyltransferase family 9 protein [Streptosporangiaceae bacterium]
MTAGGPADRPVLLVLRALGLGDLLTAVPALRALRGELPGHRLILALPEALAPLALLTGAVDEVLPAAGLAPLPPLDGPVDIAVNLHGSGPQSHRVLSALRPRELMAFAHPEFPEIEGPRWNPAEHEVTRWCRLLAGYGFRPDPGDLGLPVPEVASPAPGAVVIHPGAAYPARRWPADRYAAVAAAVRAAGHQVVVTGGPAETGLARRVVTLAGLPPEADLSARTSPLELAALVAAARLVVCGDTGVGHVATAYRTPSVVLFGPTSPALWGPPEDRADHTVLTGRPGREGRDGDPHGMTPDPGLLAIDADRVVAAALTTGRIE